MSCVMGMSLVCRLYFLTFLTRPLEMFLDEGLSPVTSIGQQVIRQTVEEKLKKCDMIHSETLHMFSSLTSGKSSPAC